MKIHITNCNKKAPYQYVNLIADAFKTLGHEVFKFDDADYSSFNLTIDRLVRRSPLFLLTKKRPDYFDFKERHKNFIGKKWLETLKDFQPDLVLLINVGWLSREAVRIAKENLRVPKIVCWVVDDPKQSAAEDLVGFLPYCNIIFVVDPDWIPFINFFNKNSIYLPLATSGIYYKPLDQARDLDFSFVGSFFMKNPGGFLRAFILSHLSPSYKAEIYGPGINYFKNIYPELKNFTCYDKNINALEVNKLWNRSKLTAVIYHPQVITGTSPQVFDAALTKTLQIIQDTSTIYDLFSGINLPTFKSIPEFVAKVDYYLTHPKEREGLAEAMFKMVKERHLFIHRIKTMMELL